MLFLLLDAAVILGLVRLFNDGEMPGWGTAIATALAVSLGFLGCSHLLADYLGFFSLVPMAAVAGVVLWIACDVPIQKAMIAGVILLVYKVIVILIFVAAMG